MLQCNGDNLTKTENDSDKKYYLNREYRVTKLRKINGVQHKKLRRD